MPELTPFHYLSIVRELSYTLEHVLNASDWHEGVVDPSTSPEFREQQEFANLKVSLSRLKGSFESLSARYQDLNTMIALREQPSTSPSAMKKLEDYAREQDERHLPKELRRGTHE